jgi:segregation and condensation protein B
VFPDRLHRRYTVVVADELQTAESTTSEELDAAIAAIDAPSRLEAILLTSDRPVRLRMFSDVAGMDSAAVESAVTDLNEQYERTGRCFRIIRLADGWQMMTLPRMAPVLARLLSQRQQTRLSQAALETLAIVAYRQPILRAEIEAIRGVACGEVLRGLMERRLVRISGRAEELGRPILYGTTRDFLRIFGLAGIEDLPDVDGLQRSPSHVPASAKPEPDTIAPTNDEAPAADDDDASSDDQ